jgi:hypothetical protein
MGEDKFRQVNANNFHGLTLASELHLGGALEAC